jgi:hypothetical protein
LDYHSNVGGNFRSTDIVESVVSGDLLARIGISALTQHARCSRPALLVRITLALLWDEAFSILIPANQFIRLPANPSETFQGYFNRFPFEVRYPLKRAAVRK